MKEQKIRIGDVEFNFDKSIEENGLTIHIDFMKSENKDKMKILQCSVSDGLNTCDYSLLSAFMTLTDILHDYLKERY